MTNIVPATIVPATEASTYLNERWGIHLNANTLGALSLAGRGPALSRSLGLPDYQIEDLDRWAEYHFPAGMCEELEGYELAERVAPTSNPGPAWLVVSVPSPDADYIRDQLQAFGCNVLGPVYSPKRALDLAGSETIDAAFLDMDWNVEGAIAVAHILTGRGIPYVLWTKLREVPGTLSFGGTILRLPTNFDELADTIERHLPKALTNRMDLSKRAEWNGGAYDLEPPAHAATESCWAYRNGICSCRPWDPACARNESQAQGPLDDRQSDLFTGRDQAAT